jgi:glycosyl transferase family 25
MKVYVVHYTPLVERKVHILKELAKHNITDYEFIEIYDRDHLQPSDIAKFSKINMAEKSIFLKHIEVFKRNIENHDDIIIVLEDDSVLISQFTSDLKYCLYKLSKEKTWDITFAGESFNLHAPDRKPYQMIYESSTSRGSGMVIINAGCCKKLYNIFLNEENISLPIDHWFNYLQPKYNLKFYWTEPTLAIQGSEIGLFKTSIQPTELWGMGQKF